MTRTQSIGVVLILLGLIYAFVYAGWLRRGRGRTKPVETTEPVASENVGAPAARTADASRPDVAPVPVPPATSENVGVPAARTTDASRPDVAPVPEPPATSENVGAPAARTTDARGSAAVAAEGIAGRYLGTRVGREQATSKSLGKAAAGTMSVGPEGVTWRPNGGTALRAEPGAVDTVRDDDGAITIQWHPEPTTSHQTGFTADTAEGTAALLAALGELHGIPVADAATTTPDLTSTTEMETP